MHEYYPPELLKEWNEASLSNNFIFCKVMSENLDLCKDFLEMLLDIQIESISLAQPEATVDVDFFAKGIRLDVYVKDRTDRSFDIEMQVIGEKHLPLRARYYQSVLDISFLRPGESYDKLKESFVIFLCLEDIFGKGLPIYTFRSVCTENKNIFLDDRTTKVFCNALQYDKMPEERLRTFFKFLLEKQPDGTDFSKTLSEKVTRVKTPEDTKRIFMTLQQEIDLAASRAYEEGYKKASEAAEESILENSRKLKESGVSAEIISKCTGLPLEQVEAL